ncbi:MAG TPA: EAL domain-containing protein [Luteimonas sp.]|jgi:EAL domain-containing protein (putative c-di-GMP-specific phosphodiesterase class I)/FixJ family two-component response regulator|nr:EAL domain-containing protein [Luteimonas sp.]
MTVSPLSHSFSGSDAVVESSSRAEYPPPQYWRRWAADAAQDDAPAAVAASAPAPVAADAGNDNDDEAYRVLVVEDDASQALFAEGVLRGAGIHTQSVRNSNDVMPAMDSFRPDLVLMDLHMPGMSGTELTGVIRAHAAFAHTPIVFLTGDQDPERQFEALEIGADDFLSKPIRPRHLMAAVHSRIKRARMLARQRGEDAVRHPVTGLFHRPHLLRALGAALKARSPGSALFVEIQNTAILRERYGYAGFEQLMGELARRLAQLSEPFGCARLNDSAFLVDATGSDDQGTQALARTLRDRIRQSPFEFDGMPQRLAAAIGLGSLAHFSDPGDLLDALEQATRAARSDPTGISTHVPKQPSATGEDALVADIRTALRDGGLELSFQPVVAVAGGQDAQFQVLLRMRDADGNLHRAGKLVPAAESAGLMPDVDRWVLEQSIALMQRRRDEGRAVRLLVSQSPRTLARDLHAQWLQEMLASHGIEGPSLVIDLRLDDALLHSITLRQFCEQLVPAGVQFCLSQYAQGPEADVLLEQLPLGYLRLSPRYSDAHADPALRDELRGIIDRAHRLGLQVIGPQVENAQSAATLWMSGIDLIQGNLVQQANEALDFDFQHAVL